jgi:hypothetical protein
VFTGPPGVAAFRSPTETEVRRFSEGVAKPATIAYLNQVGLKNRDPYTCRLVRMHRG